MEGAATTMGLGTFTWTQPLTPRQPGPLVTCFGGGTATLDVCQSPQPLMTSTLGLSHVGANQLDPYLQCGRPGFDPWVGKIFWRRKGQPTPVPLPRKSHGRRRLVCYSPCGRKESGTTERLSFSFRRRGKYITFLTQGNSQMAPVMKNKLTVEFFFSFIYLFIF